MSRRRGNNEGSVVKRDDGRWMARVSLPNGKRRAFYGRTRDEAWRKMRAAMHDIERGMPLTDHRQKLDAYLDHWLTSSVKPNVRPATYTSYAGHVRLHIKPALGQIQLAKLTPQHVESMFAELLEKGLSAATVQRVRATLRRALNRAIKHDLIGRNVASLADAPPAERPQFEPLTLDQANQFLEAAAGDRLEGLYHLTLATGLRSGEALGLLWEDVDLEGCQITVRHALQRIDGKLQLVEPKTRESRRVLSFPVGIRAKLVQHRARQKRERLLAGDRWQETGFVFTSLVGTPLDATKVLKRFQKALADAGLPRIRFHDLRHCCATYLLAQGVDLQVVKEILGHSQIGLTADTYAHVLPSLKEDAAGKIGELFWQSDAG